MRNIKCNPFSLPLSFSNLFSSSSSTSAALDRPALPYGSIRYDSSGQTVSPPPAPSTPAPIDAMRKRNKLKAGQEHLFEPSEM